VEFRLEFRSIQQRSQVVWQPATNAYSALRAVGVKAEALRDRAQPNGFDLPRLINDDYFEAIRLLFNRSHYVSSANSPW
jgi:hypothetical protein